MPRQSNFFSCYLRGHRVPNKGSRKINNEVFKQNKLDFLYDLKTNEIAEIWKQIEFQQWQIDKREMKSRTILISILDGMVLGREMK